MLLKDISFILVFKIDTLGFIDQKKKKNNFFFFLLGEREYQQEVWMAH